MRYFGVHFRMARAATTIEVRNVCKAARMSARTLQLIETADEIEYGVKQKGRFEEATVAKLVRFYERQGVRFLSSQGEPGVAYRPASASPGRKRSSQVRSTAALPLAPRKTKAAVVLRGVGRGVARGGTGGSARTPPHQ